MPANLVKTPEDEQHWNEAKAQAKKEYPDADGERFWKITTSIFRRMKYRTGAHKPPAAESTKAVLDARAELIAKARGEIKEPGKRGGKGYRTKSGKWRYGAKESPAHRLASDPRAGGMYDEGHTAGLRQTAILNKHTYEKFKEGGAQLTGETDRCNHCGKSAHRVSIGAGGSGPWAWVHSHDVADEMCPKCGLAPADPAGGLCHHCAKHDARYEPKSILDARAELILKAGGEGSRGGTVIGHTQSGKPIYQNNFAHPAHANFTPQDHLDAATKHFEAAALVRRTGRGTAAVGAHHRLEETGEAHRGAARGVGQGSRGQGDYHVAVNGETKSRHTTWNAAQEAARNHALSAGQSANIRIHHRPQGEAAQPQARVGGGGFGHQMLAWRKSVLDWAAA